jgi:hypothetical protein
VYPDNLRNFSGAQLIPQPLTIHKPNGSMSGQALKLNLKLAFEWGETEASDETPAVKFLKRTRGGLFIDFAKQKQVKDSDGNAQFDWMNEQKGLITAKLGMVDLSGLLVAYRAVRSNGKMVPTSLWPAIREQDTEEQLQRKRLTAAFTHKPSLAGTAGKGTTIIAYTFEADGGIFRVSKSKEAVGQIKLSLSEELRVFRLFEMSLDTLIRTGGR